MAATNTNTSTSLSDEAFVAAGQADGDSGTVPKTGGFTSMTLLGVTNDGVFDGPDRTVLDAGGNGNPDTMLNYVRSWLGPDVLFLVERSFNRNVVVYKLRRDASGEVDGTDPVEVFWLMLQAEHGWADMTEDTDSDDSGSENGAQSPPQKTVPVMHTEDLTTVERTLAYGLNISRGDSVGRFVVGIRALRGEPLYVSNHPMHGWITAIMWKGEPLVMERIMAYTEPRAWGLWPTVRQMHVRVKTIRNQPKILYFHT